MTTGRTFDLGLGLLAVSWLLACAGLPVKDALRPDTDARRALQRESLGFVFSAGAPLPPEPTAEERSRAAEALAAASPEEVELLQEMYGEDLDLIAYAVRDSDGDGIHDFRVSDYYGKFMEGDIDIDGDGVRNVLDAAPYDTAVGGRDENGNGVPDTVDWALGDKGADAVRRQRELFARHGILLVDRSAAFTDELSRSVHDVVTRVLHAVPRDQLQAVRVVAAEELCLLAPELDDDTQAMMISQTQTLVIYRVGIDHPPFVQLGLVAHEMAHGYQFSLDFEGVDAENRRIDSQAPVFLERMRPFGWSYTPLTEDEASILFELFTPHYYGAEPTYTWREQSPERWAEWLAQLYDAVGEDYLADGAAVDLGIVGDYSLESPWEWQSDNLIAFLFGEIEAGLEGRPALVAAMREATREAWPAFRYPNLAPNVRRHFDRLLRLRDNDLAYFADTYVAPLAGVP